MDNGESKELFLTKLLTALCREKGELRITADKFESVLPGSKLFVDYDAILKEYVVRAGTRNAGMMTVGEPAQRTLWTETRPTETRVLESPQPPAAPSPKAKFVVTDEAAAEMENKLLERARKRKEQRRMQDYQQAVREVFSSESQPRSSD